MLSQPKPANTLELRVAVIGYVSVGKTTLINALFGNEYGEVAMKRTTSVVNFFRVMTSDKLGRGKDNQGGEDDSIETSPNTLSATVTLEETAADNATFRNSKSAVVQERSFDIAVAEPLHKMRPDTALTIVDVPGINEAGTSSKYKDYVNDNWHSFDIVVIVTDARQGVNTEEQVDLIKLAKENADNCKDVPIIVVYNKVDDPDNEELKALLDESRQTIKEVFSARESSTALESQSGTKKYYAASDFVPAIVPISAMHAFVYRCGSTLSFEEFCQMDTDFIDKIGKDSFGRQWRRYNNETQLQKAYEAVSEEEQRCDGLAASNFEAFKTILSSCIGDEEQQAELVKKQIEVALDRMVEAKPGRNLSASLLSAYNNLVALGERTDHLPIVFWGAFEALKSNAFVQFEDNFRATPFAEPIDQLFTYYHTLKSLPWHDEFAAIFKQVKDFVLQYAIAVVNSDQLARKSAYDKSLVIGSMLLASNVSFNNHFGPLKLHLESKYIYLSSGRDQSTCLNCKQGTRMKDGTVFCPCCDTFCVKGHTFQCPVCSYENCAQGSGSGTLVHCNNCVYLLTVFVEERESPFDMKLSQNGILEPVEKETYTQHVTVSIPESLKDKGHFGYVLWRGCNILKAIDDNEIN